MNRKPDPDLVTRYWLAKDPAEREQLRREVGQRATADVERLQAELQASPGIDVPLGQRLTAAIYRVERCRSAQAFDHWLRSA